MNHPSDPLPLLPAELLRRYSCAEPTDTRFRAIARLRQSLWREQHGYRLWPLPRRQRSHAPPWQPRQLSRRPDRHQPGRPHAGPARPARDRLSRGRRRHQRRAPLDQPAGQPGPDLQSLWPVQAAARAGHGRDAPAGSRSGRRGDRCAVRALARTRPPRLHRRLHRLRRADPLHDTAGAARLCRDRDEVLGGTGRHRLTGRPRYDALSRSAGVFRDPDAPALRHAPIEQFWREQLLVTAMLERGHYHDGRLIVIAPALNAECQAAIARYRSELVSDDPAETRFQTVTLEDLTTAVGAAGADTIAARVTERYLDFAPVHRALAETFNTPADAA